MNYQNESNLPTYAKRLAGDLEPLRGESLELADRLHVAAEPPNPDITLSDWLERINAIEATVQAIAEALKKAVVDSRAMAYQHNTWGVLDETRANMSGKDCLLVAPLSSSHLDIGVIRRELQSVHFVMSECIDMAHAQAQQEQTTGSTADCIRDGLASCEFRVLDAAMTLAGVIDRLQMSAGAVNDVES